MTTHSKGRRAWSNTFFAGFDAVLAHSAVGNVSNMLAILAVFVANELWLRRLSILLVLLALLTYNRAYLGSQLSKIVPRTQRAQRWLSGVSALIIVAILFLACWHFYTVYFRNEVPIATYPLTAHSWGPSKHTERSDETGQYIRWEYNRDTANSYAGYEYAFIGDSGRDLTAFKAIRLRMGFEDDSQACFLYVKDKTQSTPTIVDLQRNHIYPEQVTMESGVIDTITVPLDYVFGSVSRDHVEAIGFQAGGSRYPLTGACRIYSVELLRTEP
jgi:hypothetical protein